MKIVLGFIGLTVLLVGIGFGLTALYPLRYETMIASLAKEQGLDPYLVFGVIRTESRFRPHVVSQAGAIGLMQIAPMTGKWIAEKLQVENFVVDDLYLPEMNIRFGTWYLRYLIDRFGGEIDLALVAYNAGPGNVDRWQRNGDIYPESAAYLDAVWHNQGIYKFLYGSFLGPVLRHLQTEIAVNVILG